MPGYLVPDGSGILHRVDVPTAAISVSSSGDTVAVASGVCGEDFDRSRVVNIASIGLGSSLPSMSLVYWADTLVALRGRVVGGRDLAVYLGCEDWNFRVLHDPLVGREVVCQYVYPASADYDFRLISVDDFPRYAGSTVVASDSIDLLRLMVATNSRDVCGVLTGCEAGKFIVRISSGGGNSQSLRFSYVAAVGGK